MLGAVKQLRDRRTLVFLREIITIEYGFCSSSSGSVLFKFLLDGLHERHVAVSGLLFLLFLGWFTVSSSFAVIGNFLDYRLVILPFDERFTR